MTQSERLSQIATQLAEDAPELPTVPWLWYARSYTGGLNICGNNGGGCGKPFTNRVFKRRPQE